MATSRFASVRGAARLRRGSTSDAPVAGFAVPRVVRVVVVGAHGGAGATSVCDLLDLADSADCEDPAHHPNVSLTVEEAARRLPRPDGATVVVVARTSASGVAAAADLVRGQPHEAARLVLVADAPAPPPPAVRYRAEALAGQLPVLWVPWLWPLRAVARVAEAADSRKVRAAAASLRKSLIEEGQA